MNNYPLHLYKFPVNNNSIFNYDNKIKTSSNQNEPLIKLGFFYYLNQTKDKMSILNDEKFKNKDFYLVINNFEHKIKDFENDIYNLTKNFFNIKTQEKEIISRAFYKLWEILILFDLVPIDKSIISAHLAEGPGAFVQAVILYREKYNQNYSNKDKYCAITLNDNTNNLNLNKRKLECYSKNNIQRYYQHKFSKNDNGDLTKINVINNFTNDILKNNDKAFLVTADGGFIWNNENYQEQESYKLILSEIISCLKIQKKGGNFVLKIYDILTNITIKLLILLSEFYEDIYIFKPYLSRISNSEKYIVCKNFIPNNNLDTNIKKLEYILEDINKLDKNTYLFDIFPDYEISENIYKFIEKINIKLLNLQYIEMNKIINFLNKGDYFGEDYHKYKEEQIMANKNMNNNFYKNNLNEVDKIRNKIKDIKNN